MKKKPIFRVEMKLNTGTPNGDWVWVSGNTIAELVQNCIDATYCHDIDGCLEVLEVKETEV